MGCECDTCWYYDYDEEFDEYVCIMDLDEDEMYRFLTSGKTHCPYYRQGDDYTLARKQ
jgi:hypothetical protein